MAWDGMEDMTDDSGRSDRLPCSEDRSDCRKTDAKVGVGVDADKTKAGAGVDRDVGLIHCHPRSLSRDYDPDHGASPKEES
jgi:hypothetical protein